MCGRRPARSADVRRYGYLSLRCDLHSRSLLLQVRICNVLLRRKAWSKARAAQLGAGDPSVLRRLGVRAYGLWRGDPGAREGGTRSSNSRSTWGVHRQSEHERYLTTKKPVIVMNYAKAIIMICRRHVPSFSSSVVPQRAAASAPRREAAPSTARDHFGSYSHVHRQIGKSPQPRAMSYRGSRSPKRDDCWRRRGMSVSGP